MSIDMYLADSQTQASSVAARSRNRQSGLRQLKQEADNFILNSPGLHSDAYNNAKDYFSRVLLPLVNGATMLDEAIAQGCDLLPTAYAAQVGSEDLKSAELKIKIEEAKAQITRLDSIRLDLTSMSPNASNRASLLSKNARSRSTAFNSLQKLQEQLAKLEAYDANSASFFSNLNVDALASALETGFTMARQSFHGGKFNIPDEMEWADEINELLEDKLKAQEPVKTIVAKTVENARGEEHTIYEVYIDGVLDAEETKKVRDLYAKEGWEAFKKFLKGAAYQIAENNGKDILDKAFGDHSPTYAQDHDYDFNSGRVAGNLFSLLQSGAEFIAGGTYFVAGTGGSLAFALPSGGWSLGAIPAVAASSAGIVTHAAGVGSSALVSLFSDGKGGAKASGSKGLGSGNVGDFSNLQGSSVDDVLSRIPKDANKRELTPQPGKVTEGFEYTWKLSDGTKMTVRVHGPDASAPVGSNAANGWVVRVQQGKKYLDPVSGDFQPPGISRPNSEFYSEELINSTHIPIQTPKK